MNLKIVFIAIVFSLSSILEASDSYWFGTINFSKTFKSEETLTYQKGDPYYPGNKVDISLRTWSGEIRYLANKKAIISARFSDKTSSKRKTQGTRPCPWKDGQLEFRDFETVEYTVNFSTNREISDDLNIRINDDGTYSISKSVTGGKHLANARIDHSRRERFDACDPQPQKIDEQYQTSSDGMDSVDFRNISGITDINSNKLIGKWTGKDRDGGDLTYSWEFTKTTPKLIARINAPSLIERAQMLTLDASSSEGNIKEYTWSFVPNGDCMMTPSGTELKLKGPKVSFIALCDFTAYLDIENDEEVDFARHTIIVTPREASNWKTHFKTQIGPHFTKRINSWELPFGSNPCSFHEDGTSSSHVVHTDSINMQTWLDSGYKITKVEDGGPFQNSWYIESQNLQVNRSEKINTNILPGGEIYTLNVKNNNLKDIQDLIGQTKKHEQLHSTLIQEELQRLGQDGDAAQKIEGLIAPEADILQFMADREVRELNTLLMSATGESKVQDRLRAMGFLRNIGIWIYLADDDNDPTNNQVIKHEMGPLWSIGDSKIPE